VDLFSWYLQVVRPSLAHILHDNHRGSLPGGRVASGHPTGVSAEPASARLAVGSRAQCGLLGSGRFAPLLLDCGA